MGGGGVNGRLGRVCRLLRSPGVARETGRSVPAERSTAEGMRLSMPPGVMGSIGVMDTAPRVVGAVMRIGVPPECGA